MNKITKEDILFKTDGGLDIYQHVLTKLGSHTVLKDGKNRNLKNPFYADKKPSLSIFKKDGQFLFKDHGDDNYKGDAFTFYGLFKNLDPKTEFGEILQSIESEVLHIPLLHSSKFRKPQSIKRPNIELGGDFQYWQDLFPHIENIEKRAKEFGLVAINKCFIGEGVMVSSKTDPIFGFELGEAMKIYRPLNTTGSKHLWIDKPLAEYTRYRNLFELEKPCIITEGYKDGFSAYLHGFNVFPLDNAQSGIDVDQLNWFRVNNMNLITCLDNDQAGIKGMTKLEQELGLKSIRIPKDLEGAPVKDLTDLLQITTGLGWLLNEVQAQNFSKVPQNENVRMILEDREKIFERSKHRIDWAKPLICMNDSGLIYRNTINTLIGPPGTHKSRLCECIAAAALSSSSSQKSGFGLLDGKGPAAVLYVDTERNLNDQLPYAIQQIRRLASGNPFNSLPNLDAISLVSIKREERFDTLSEYLENQIERSERHLLIIIDVVTDCVIDFNRVDGSLELNDFMNELINQRDVTFLVVIHANPFSTKARGHLGTELVNKSSYVGSLKFHEDGIIELSTTKLRVSKPLDPIFLRFDEEEKHLVQIDYQPPVGSDTNIQRKAPVRNIAVHLGKYKTNVDHKAVELREDIVKMFECSERTADERISQIINDGILIENGGGPHVLVRPKKGVVRIELKEMQTQLTLGEDADAQK